MSSRSKVRGPGSNQHKDQPPKPPRDATAVIEDPGLGEWLHDPFDDSGPDGGEAAAVADLIRDNHYILSVVGEDRVDDAVSEVLSAFDRADTDGLSRIRRNEQIAANVDVNLLSDVGTDNFPRLVSYVMHARREHRLMASDPPAFDSHDQFADWMSNADTDSNWVGLDGPWRVDGYEMAVAFDEPTADPGHLVAYYMRGPGGMGSDGFDGDQPGTPIGPVDDHGRARVWKYGCDLTKSRRDDLGMAMDGFTDHIEHGSPVRKTNRSGPGTKGTQAVPGTGQRPRVAFRD